VEGDIGEKMTINTLSLPIDIPWKRLCVSSDMIDDRGCDREFPFRWLSSVSVFSYEPPEEHQTYEGMTVSYLKITCTITGWQPGGTVGQIGFENPLAKIQAFATDTKVIEAYKSLLKYYPCHGALLEVSLTPTGDAETLKKIPKSTYPYIIDFEPKKREVYELVSQTGESMSRTLSEVNVQKGMTTTTGAEILDVDKQIDMRTLGMIAGGVGGFAVGGPAGAVGGAALGGQLGGLLGGGGETSVRDMNQSQKSNVRTTDHAREMRELHSHTTQLTQMYHQFTGYHLGTNRAVFLMLPRPHIVQSEHTFVNGPRQLEGLQEIFLSVIRPRDMQDMVIDAHLETAHLEGIPYGEPAKRIQVVMYSVGGERDWIGGQWPDTYNLDKHNRYGMWTYVPPAGWEIDMERNDGGYLVEATVAPATVQIAWESAFTGADVQTWYQVTVADNGLSAGIEAKVGVATQFDPKEPKKVYYGRLTLNITFYLRRVESQTLFLTGRGVCCAPPVVIEQNPEYITYEAKLLVAEPDASGPNMKASGMSLLEANMMQNRIGYQMIQSLSDPERYARGDVSFTEAQFVARDIAEVIDQPDHPDNQSIQELAGLKPELRDKIVSARPELRRADILSMQLQETMDRFELTHEDAVHLRRAALGIEQQPVDPKDRWDPPSHRRVQVVPNVIGFPLVEASSILESENLSVGETIYQDSEQPTDIVLNQRPESGMTVRGGTKIQLVIATGLTVRIPDVIDKPLTEVLLILREAGLQSEPELEFVKGQRKPKHSVLQVTPASRTYVTPNARVVLKIAE
jgi:hypothetical protein